jgi:hypothetical protein
MTTPSLALFSYDMQEDPLVLQPILPQSIQSFIVGQINEVMDMGANGFFDLNKYTGAKKGKDLLEASHYTQLLKSAARKYIEYSRLWNISKENRNALMKMKGLRYLLEELLLKVAAFKHLFSETMLLKKLVRTLVTNRDFPLLDCLMSNYKPYLEDVVHDDYFIDFVIKNNQLTYFNSILELHLKNDLEKPINERGDTALHLALRYQSLGILQCLLNNKVNLHSQNLEAQSPLTLIQSLPYLESTPAYQLLKDYQRNASEQIQSGTLISF